MRFWRYLVEKTVVCQPLRLHLISIFLTLIYRELDLASGRIANLCLPRALFRWYGAARLNYVRILLSEAGFCRELDLDPGRGVQLRVPHSPFGGVVRFSSFHWAGASGRLRSD